LALFATNHFPDQGSHSRIEVLFNQKIDWAGLGLAAPRADFPVSAPYRVSSDLSKLEGRAIATDEHFEKYFNAKLSILQHRPDALLLPEKVLGASVWQEIWQCLGLDQATSSKVLGLLPPEHGDRATNETGLRADGLAAMQVESAQRLSLALQEDWVLVSPHGRFEAGSVCFPSGWAPSEKFGLTLAEIHAPVADGEALRKASEALARAMLHKGPFERFVWTLTRSASLSRHPAYPEDQAAESAEALYFRYERQTTLALPLSGRALFLIRVYVQPLEVALCAGATASNVSTFRKEKLRLLQASLSSMSDAVINYKGLSDIREQVLAMPS
jgi:hypothetical protein